MSKEEMKQVKGGNVAACQASITCGNGHTYSCSGNTGTAPDGSSLGCAGQDGTGATCYYRDDNNRWTLCKYPM